MTPANSATVKKEGITLTSTEAAKEARNAYYREWFRQHPEKRKQYQDAYWTRKAQSDRQKTAENGKTEGDTA